MDPKARAALAQALAAAYLEAMPPSRRPRTRRKRLKYNHYETLDYIELAKVRKARDPRFLTEEDTTDYDDYDYDYDM